MIKPDKINKINFNDRYNALYINNIMLYSKK